MTKLEISVVECVAELERIAALDEAEGHHEIARFQRACAAHLSRLEGEGGCSEQVAERPIVDAQSRAPTGWRFVPIEPTWQMCDAGEGFNLRCGCPECDHEAWTKIAEGYRAMLAAAPTDDGALAPEQLSPPPILNPSQNPPETET